jgi:hypothetical protein
LGARAALRQTRRAGRGLDHGAREDGRAGARAAALIGACCGSDDHDRKPPPDGDRAASRRFVRELDALCERADRLAAGAQARFDQVKSEASSNREAARGTV